MKYGSIYHWYYYLVLAVVCLIFMHPQTNHLTQETGNTGSLSTGIPWKKAEKKTLYFKQNQFGIPEYISIVEIKNLYGCFFKPL